MKAWLVIIASLALAGGCMTLRTPPAPQTAAPDSQFTPNPNNAETNRIIVTPDERLIGKVILFNPTGRFVVISCPLDKMPAFDQILFAYRNGLKVGELRVTGPQREQNTVADVTSGEAQKGDEIRNK